MIPVSIDTDDVPLCGDTLLGECPNCQTDTHWTRVRETTDDGTPFVTGACNACGHVTSRATDWGGRLIVRIGDGWDEEIV